MLPLFPQELPTSCVAACVRMVLTSLGHRLNETDIRHRCGHTALGMRLNQVASGLEDLPIDVQHQLDWGSMIWQMQFTPTPFQSWVLTSDQ